MNPSQLVRILASVRIPSSHGSDIDYEIVQAVVRSAANPKETREAVIVRLVVLDQPLLDRAAEILVQDLPAVQAQWTRFVQDVLWRRAQGSDSGTPTALPKPDPTSPPAVPAVPVILASGGRFGGASGETPFIPARKERRRSEPLVLAGPKGEASPPPATLEQAAFEPPKVPSVPEQFEVIGYNLSAPPTAEGLMKPLQDHPKHLVIVTPMALVSKVEVYLKGVREGKIQSAPAEFTPIIVRRSATGSVTNKKLRAQLTMGIAQMLGTVDRVLWITAE